jgi:hypothetical protein
LELVQPVVQPLVMQPVQLVEELPVVQPVQLLLVQ